MRGRTIFFVVATVSCGLVSFFVFMKASAAQTTVDQVPAVIAAANWLVTAHQNIDGGYTSFSQGAGMAESDVGGTVDAILALAGAGYNVDQPVPGRDASPIDFLRSNPDAVAAFAAQNGGSAGKLILALAAAAQDPADFGGQDYILQLQTHLSPTGQYGVNDPFNQSLAILAQSVVSDSVPDEALGWLEDRQATEGPYAGSWDDGFGTEGNTDSTAMAIMALLAAGSSISDTAVVQARSFLTEAQLDSGGWGYAEGLPASANSTALVVQALHALGEDFYSANSEWARNSLAPLSWLLGEQTESGAFEVDFGDGPQPDFLTTAQAMPALAGRSLPLPARHEAATAGLSCLATLQSENGGWPEFAGSEPDAGGTARAIEAIVAAGADPTSASWTDSGRTPLNVLGDLAPDYFEGGRGGRVGKVMQATVAAGGDVRDLAGTDLVAQMTTYLSPTGEYADTSFGPFSHAEAMLGLLEASESVAPESVDWLLAAQSDDGGWGDPDATGITLQVFGALGVEASALQEETEAAIGFLKSSQQADGGWGFALPSSPNSSAEVSQGLAAIGENPFDPGWSKVVSGTLHNAADVVLVSQQEDGCWPNMFGPGSDPFATTDAIVLLSLEPSYGTFNGTTEEDLEEDLATPTAITPDDAEPAPTEVTPTSEPVEAATAEPAPAETEVADAESPAPTASSATAPSPDSDQAGEGDADSGAELPVVVLVAFGVLLVAALVFVVLRRPS